ncbi:MAG: ATP-binding protein [Verrucomicrobiota bacterium]
MDPAGSATTPGANTRDDLPGELNILLIEDNVADARLAEHMLREEPDRMVVNIQTHATLSGAIEALSAEPNRFDVVLLDLSLPDSMGPETFQQIHLAAPKLPIIILSGLTDEEMATHLVSMGAQDYMLKDGMEPATMRRSIRYAIERKASSEKLTKLNADLERKNEELRTMQLQLIQAEKMESIGRLAAGVAHEVKNPLAMIQLGVDYLMEGVDVDDPNLAKILGRMQNAVVRADAIICGLVDFSSARQLDLESGDINALAENSLLLVKHEITKKSIQVDKSIEANLPLVKIDHAKMEQVLINLLMNAIQAMPEGGTLGISTIGKTLESHERDRGARTVDQLRTGDPVIVLRIDDSGCGIPSDKIDQIFDPFFTTKETGQGTGLGLTVVKKIIELHKGSISLENRPEGGCRTEIILKAAQQSQEAETV